MPAPVTLAILLLSSGCVPWRRDRIAPAQSAGVAQARADIALAAGSGDVDAILRHLAPGARLVLGADTFDLREAVRRFGGRLTPGTTPELYFEPRRLRQCEQWLYESGGRLGLVMFAAGEPPAARRYRYAIAWITDSASTPLIETVALVRTWYADVPRIAGCRPTASDQLERRRLGVVIMPGPGIAALGGAQDGIERTMRDRSLEPGAQPARAGYPEPGTSSATVVGAWYRASRRLRLEITGATTTTMNTFGVDTAGFMAVGMNLQRVWVAASAAYDRGNLRVGAGPAFLREAWAVRSDSLLTDPSGAPAGVLHLSDASIARNHVGLFTQAVLTVPFSGRLFAELRGYVLWLPASSSPPALGYAPSTVTSRGAGLGVALGVAF
jgi:hypothetical protein